MEYFTSIGFLVLGVILYSLIALNNRDFFHPSAVGAFIWFLTSSISLYPGFYDWSIQEYISVETTVSVAMAGVFFSVPAILLRVNFKEVLRARHSDARIEFGAIYYTFINFFSVLTLLAFFVRFEGQLGSPALFAIGQSIDIKNNVPDGIPILHYFDYITPIVALTLIYEWFFNDRVSRKRRIVIALYMSFVVISTVFYKVSRGEFLLICLGFVYLLYAKSVISGRRVFIKLFLWIFALLVVVVLLGVLRISEQSRVSGQFGEGVGIVFSQIYTYFSFNFQNLNALVVSETPHTYVWATWRFLLKFFYAGDFRQAFDIVDYELLFFNAKTFIYYFYHDLGIPGVILYSFLIGSFVELVYKVSVRDIRFVLVLAVIQKPIFFLFFGNYFFGEFIMVFGLLFTFAAVFTMRCRVRGNAFA